MTSSGKRKKDSLYRVLVNTHPGIAYRYHNAHDGKKGPGKVASWVYLLWLNFAYYFLFCHFLGNIPLTDDERKTIPDPDISESENAKKDFVQLLHEEGPVSDDYMRHLSEYDIISFDMFDTLIFRPVSEPDDLFFFIGERTGVLNFKELRVNAERACREKRIKEKGHAEVTLEEIWKMLENEIGISAAEGMNVEMDVERKLCYANPVMLKVWQDLKSAGKHLIVITDMYLPEKCIRDILDENGFSGADKIYVSCEYGLSKADGHLYDKALFDLGVKKFIHVGDNPYSDMDNAKRKGLDILPYPKVKRKAAAYRPYDMSAMVGSAYRGIVSNHLYNGFQIYSMEYEYGFIYGGLFVLGYCHFIHECFKNSGADKILFLSRDGDILMQVYKRLYPNDCAEYVYWSRKAALKLMAPEDKNDFFKRFIDHKTNQGYTISSILKSMELEQLLTELPDGLAADDLLTTESADALKVVLEKSWSDISLLYSSQIVAAEKYLRSVLSECKKALAVDIGWAGSGAMALSHLVERVWQMPCEIEGIVAGTNTIYNTEPDAAEPFLQSGKMKSYMYSQSHNRDLLKKHDPGKGYNIYWELLLASPEPRFAGYYDAAPQGDDSYVYDENSGIYLKFAPNDIDPEKATEVQKGILDFVTEYTERFKEYPYMMNISGRDAYAPMITVAGKKERFLRRMAERFDPDVNVE